jgi:hypothetical protein
MVVQALCDALPDVCARCLDHHSASFDRLRMRDIAAAPGALVAATTFLILSLSKDPMLSPSKHAECTCSGPRTLPFVAF